jgi:hypothetical protein
MHIWNLSNWPVRQIWRLHRHRPWFHVQRLLLGCDFVRSVFLPRRHLLPRGNERDHLPRGKVEQQWRIILQ